MTPESWRAAQLFPPAFICPTNSSFPKTWARDQDSVPRKGHRLPRDSPLARSQPGNLCCPILVQLFCPAHPAPTPALRPEAGREGPGWFTSSRIVFQTMGKVPLSQTRDSPLHRPKLGQREKGGRLRGRKLSAGPDDQRNPCRLGKVGEEGSKAKMSWVQTVPTTLPWTLAPTVRQSKGSGYGALVKERLFHAQRDCTAGGDVKPLQHTGYSCAISGGDETLSRAVLQALCPVRPWRREVCTKDG